MGTGHYGSTLAPVPKDAPTSAPRSWSDRLLTQDPLQRLRLSQQVLAMALMLVCIACMQALVWQGMAPRRAVAWWTLFSVGGLLLGYVAIRSGWSQRFADRSLTQPQMFYAVTCAAAAYGLAGPGRAGVFLTLAVILMFGMFAVPTRQLMRVALYAVAVFGVVMLMLVEHDAKRFPPAVEAVHFVMLATMLPALSALAGRLGVLRERAREQQRKLASALERITELATRDELTGLINWRHMQELMAQEHQRCVRSGHTFCLVAIDLDHFKRLNQVHGRAAGDDLLRGVAAAARSTIRMSDMLSRRSSDTMVLLQMDTRALLARSGVERLRECIERLRVPLAENLEMQVTISAGLVEHHAGETVEQTLERADRALAEAKAQGRNRVVLG